MTWRKKSIGEVISEMKEKAEQYTQNRMDLGKFPAFMMYGLGTIFLLKISQFVLGWSF